MTFGLTFEGYADIVQTSDVGSDEWYAAVNTLRVACGLPPTGHGLTFDFWLAHTSTARYRETFHGAHA